MSFIHQIEQHAKNSPTDLAMSQKIDGNWQHLNWQEIWGRVQRTASQLKAQGVNKGDRIAIIANNCIEWTLVDLASIYCGAISVPIYATSTPLQIQYILEHSDAKVLFTDAACLSIAQEARSNMEAPPVLVSLEPTEGVDHAVTEWAKTPSDPFPPVEATSDDLLTIVYTSGTTGQPKGVMINHGNLKATIDSHLQNFVFNHGDRSIAALPLSHIFERGWTYIVLFAGGHNHYINDVTDLANQLSDIRPHVFCAVPRIFEKIHAGIFAKADAAGGLSKKIVYWAAEVVKKNLACELEQREPSFALKAQLNLARALVGKKIQNALGGNITFIPCGGAALDAETHSFFMALGVNLKLGFGMTETFATVTFMPDNDFRYGTVGKAMPGIEIRIDPRTEEMLVRSPSMTPGYYKDPIATKDLIKDGWLYTGDAGRIDAEGHVYFTERLKELMKTSGGKYIAPQQVEGIIAREQLFEQVAVIADAKKYASALIVPAWDRLEAYANSLNLAYETRRDLLKNTKILEHVEEKLKQVQKDLARYEQIKRFTLLLEPFSMDEGEITPTLKLRRKVISQRYADEIAQMYS